MRYSQYILITAACFCSAFVYQIAPDLFTIKQKHTFFTTDNLNNAYIINGEEIFKYNPSGKLLSKFSNKRFGNITSVDATNSLKVLLYYKDFQQLLFLDNQLSLNGEVISLENLGLEQCDLTCTSFNNSFWIYSKQNNELVRYNENSKLIAKTGNLKQLLQAEIKPNFMIEHNSYLYLNCPEIGIYVFDMYGTFNKIISIKNLNSLQVSNSILYFFANGKFTSYNSKTLDERSIPARDSLINNIRIEKDRLYLQYPDSVKVLDNQIK